MLVATSLNKNEIAELRRHLHQQLYREFGLYQVQPITLVFENLCYLLVRCGDRQIIKHQLRNPLSVHKKSSLAVRTRIHAWSTLQFLRGTLDRHTQTDLIRQCATCVGVCSAEIRVSATCLHRCLFAIASVYTRL